MFLVELRNSKAKYSSYSSKKFGHPDRRRFWGAIFTRKKFLRQKTHFLGQNSFTSKKRKFWRKIGFLS